MTGVANGWQETMLPICGVKGKDRRDQPSKMSNPTLLTKAMTGWRRCRRGQPKRVLPTAQQLLQARHRAAMHTRLAPAGPIRAAALVPALVPVKA